MAHVMNVSNISVSHGLINKSIFNPMDLIFWLTWWRTWEKPHSVVEPSPFWSSSNILWGFRHWWHSDTDTHSSNNTGKKSCLEVGTRRTKSVEPKKILTVRCKNICRATERNGCLFMSDTRFPLWKLDPRRRSSKPLRKQAQPSAKTKTSSC